MRWPEKAQREPQDRPRRPQEEPERAQEAKNKKKRARQGPIIEKPWEAYAFCRGHQATKKRSTSHKNRPRADQEENRNAAATLK